MAQPPCERRTLQAASTCSMPQPMHQIAQDLRGGEALIEKTHQPEGGCVVRLVAGGEVAVGGFVHQTIELAGVCQLHFEEPAGMQRVGIGQ